MLLKASRLLTYTASLLAIVAMPMANAANERLMPTGFNCSPDCAFDFSSLNGTVGYSVSGSTGTLTYTGTSGNVVLPDEAVAAGTPGTGEPDGQFGYSVSPFFSPPFTNIGDPFSITIEFDTSLLAGAFGGFQANAANSDVDINGAVLQDGSLAPVVTAAPDNTQLTGDLLTSDIFEFGYLDDEIEAGSSGSTLIIDFFGNIDAGNTLISGVMPGDSFSQGQLNINIANIAGYNRNQGWWEQNWSGTANVNVVVPVPAAFWLFASAIAAVFGARRVRA